MSDEPTDDPEAWVDRHGDCLYGYALVRLRDPSHAADVVQDVFLEALRARDAFAGRSSERTWLVGILKHKIADHFRRSSREAGTTNGASAPEFDRHGRWRVPPGAWAGEPSLDVQAREFWEVFGRCLAKLPGGVAEAFLLREMDGLTSEEVRQHLGITPANLWTRLHRARSLLRQCLESAWFGRRSEAIPGTAPDPKKGPPPS